MSPIWKKFDFNGGGEPINGTPQELLDRLRTQFTKGNFTDYPENFGPFINMVLNGRELTPEEFVLEIPKISREYCKPDGWSYDYTPQLTLPLINALIDDPDQKRKALDEDSRLNTPSVDQVLNRAFELHRK